MHWLTHFGTVATGFIELPQYDVKFNAGAAPADAPVVKVIGGESFDPYGDERAPQKYPYNLQYACTVVGPAAATTRAQIDVLKGLIGRKSRLWKTNVESPGDTRWAYARVVDIDDTMQARLPKWNVPVTITFQVYTRWHGAQHGGSWTFDSGEYFDSSLAFDAGDSYVLNSSPKSLTIANNGKIPVRDAIILITAGTADMNNLIIAVSGVSEIRYTGTIAAGQTLQIDCGTKTVLNNGVAAWNEFSLTNNHQIADWLRLEPGNNTVVVTRSGGSNTATAEFVFTDGWA